MANVKNKSQPTSNLNSCIRHSVDLAIFLGLFAHAISVILFYGAAIWLASPIIGPWFEMIMPKSTSSDLVIVLWLFGVAIPPVFVVGYIHELIGDLRTEVKISVNLLILTHQMVLMFFYLENLKVSSYFYTFAWCSTFISVLYHVSSYFNINGYKCWQNSC